MGLLCLVLVVSPKLGLCRKCHSRRVRQTCHRIDSVLWMKSYHLLGRRIKVSWESDCGNKIVSNLVTNDLPDPVRPSLDEPLAKRQKSFHNDGILGPDVVSVPWTSKTSIQDAQKPHPLAVLPVRGTRDTKQASESADST